MRMGWLISMAHICSNMPTCAKDFILIGRLSFSITDGMKFAAFCSQALCSGWTRTMRYFSHDPIHRRYHHNQLTFRMLYGFTENFVLPLSHDEVVHGKGSLLNKMPGDEWQRFANLRLLFGYMYAQPGKKLLFMGGEFGQSNEWSHDRSLDWHLLG